MRFIFLHLPVLGEESVRAAEATECAGEQDRFWEYHDALFENSGGESGETFADANLVRFASDLSLDIPAFQDCLDSRRYLERIGVHRQLARSINITATPSVIVENQVMSGLRDYTEYQQQIDLALTNRSQ